MSGTLSLVDGFLFHDNISVNVHPIPSGGTQTIYSSVSDSWSSNVDIVQQLGTYNFSGNDLASWGLLPGGGGQIVVDFTSVTIRKGCDTPAQATFLQDSAGVYLPNFTVTAPRMGRLWDLTVVNPPAPFVTSQVVGYRNATEITFPFGVLLVDLAGPELLRLNPVLGTVGHWSVMVPADPALCGTQFTVQAYGYGLGYFGLYNGYTVKLGA